MVARGTGLPTTRSHRGLSTMIYCRTLGPVELTVDGSEAPAELLWRKNLALLIYLARSPNRSRSRQHLTALLWGDKPERAARQSLREALRVLRRWLGEDALHADGDVIRLDPRTMRLDTDRFEELETAGDLRGASATSSVMIALVVANLSEQRSGAASGIEYTFP